MKQFEILGGYEATWIIRTKSGGHYLYQESYHEDGLYSVTVFRVSSDEAVDLGCLDGRIGDNGIEDVNAFSWVERINLLGTMPGNGTSGSEARDFRRRKKMHGQFSGTKNRSS